MSEITMDDGLLSQEDIDALTAGLLGGDDGGDDGSDSSGSGIDPEFLRGLFKLICDQASSVVSTVLSKNADFKIMNIEVAEANSIEQDLLVDTLDVKVGVENDLTGNFYYMISKEITATLSDLMMMGDGTAAFDEEHKDALSELVNQIMGSVNTTMTEEYRTTLSFSQADLSVVEQNYDFDSRGGVVAKISVKIEEISDSIIYLLADKKLCETFIAHTQGSNEESVDTPSGASVESAPSTSSVPEFTPNELAAPAATSGGGGGGLFESSGNRVLDMLLDVPLNMTIELGRTQMSIRRILEMGPGSIIELDRFAGEPVDLLVNNKVVARGEVVVVDENFGIRIVSLVTPEERIKFLK